LVRKIQELDRIQIHNTYQEYKLTSEDSLPLHYPYRVILEGGYGKGRKSERKMMEIIKAKEIK
jgi:hypothetical protein